MSEVSSHNHSPLEGESAKQGRSPQLSRWGVWGGYLITLLCLPLLFDSVLGVSILNQMAVAIVFALSYNMLLGQGGMLSFGHAVYFGLGGFLAVHGLLLTEQGALALPTALVPLGGGLCGLLAAMFVGAFSTRRAGTVFAMISLGIGELVAASSLIFSGFFGGEAGVSGDRSLGPPLFGVQFLRDVEVYYLAACWVFAATAFMYLFTRTPAGRMANAVRDNPQRAGFIGYSARRVRFISFCGAGFFAGIAGGLYALNYEFITDESLNAATSGRVLLTAYIGGLGYFIGPMIGAVVLTLMNSLLSNYTDLWMLYLGLMFLLTVMFLPRGFAGFIMMHRAAWLHGRLQRLLLPYGITGAPALLTAAACVGMVETLHRGGAVLLYPALMLAAAAGLYGVHRSLPGLRKAWDEVNQPGDTEKGQDSNRSPLEGEQAKQGCQPEVEWWGDDGRNSADIDNIDTPILSIEAVHKTLGGSDIIRGVSLSLRPGERHALIGPNGAGKSTLFHLISGGLRPDSGSIRLRGRPIHRLPPHRINRLGLARSFQVTNIFPRLSVFENLRCALLWSRGYGCSFWHLLERETDLNRRAHTLMERLGLQGSARLPAGELAYAQQRALELGITIAGGAGLVLLDEPVAGMSRSESAAAVALIRDITEGRSLLMVEHDMDTVFDIADRISVLVYGEIIASGAPEEIRADRRVQEAYLGEAVADVTEEMKNA